jgi:sugar lactone lactonase YvrE
MSGQSVVRSEARIFRSGGADLGEGPFWDPAGELVWVDINARRVIRSPLDGAPGGSDDHEFQTPSSVGFVVPAVDGALALGLADGVYLSDADGGNLRVLAPIEHPAPGMRLNDGLADPEGRLLAGSIVLERETEPVASLYSIDLAGDVRTLRGGFGNANGLDWSLDGSLLYFTDTRQRTIYVADYTDDGSIENERPFSTGQRHDGLTVDSEGHVWGAIYGEGLVVRITPGGEVTERIEVPTPNTTSVAFGGPGLQTLFITTAAQGLEPGSDPNAGAVFAVDLEVAGRHPNVFGAATQLGPSG